MVAARKLGLSAGNFHACCTDKTKPAGEYESTLVPLAEDPPDRTGDVRLVAGGAAREWRIEECVSVSHLGWVRTAQGVINEGCERQDGYRDVGTNGKALRLIRMLGVDCVLKETRQRWSQGHPMGAQESRVGRCGAVVI